MVKFTKKGQAEMIGLVVIVIMITLGMLFLAKFAIDEDTDKKVFTRKGLAYSSMSSLLKTEVTCEEPGESTVKVLSMGKELIDDCVKHIGDTRSYNSCGGLHSCDYMEEMVTELLESTLGTWQKSYNFQSALLMSDRSETFINVEGGEGCLRSSDRDSSGLFPIFVTNEGLVENVLYLCD